jgi:hypothetical protein
MALSDILKLSKDYSNTKEEVLTEERIKAILPIVR